MIKVVIFDMDGLMFDTERLWVEEGYLLARKLNYNLPQKLFYQTIGLKNKETELVFSKYLNSDFDIESFRSLYHTVISNKILKEGIKIKKGLKELLVYLKNNNYKIAIASSNKRDRIYFYLINAGIAIDLFDIIVSGEELLYSKPNPLIFKLVMNKLKVKASETLILEDSIFGIVAAKNIGSHVIVIPDIMNLPDNIEDICDYKLNNLMEVIDILKHK